MVVRIANNDNTLDILEQMYAIHIHKTGRPPTEIAACKSLFKHSEHVAWCGIRIVLYNEWLAKGQIIMS